SIRLSTCLSRLSAAGIPDFRSPSCGIYDNLEEFNLPYPMAVFTVDYFQRDPKPFFEVCRRMYRPEAKPTLTHYFIRLLHEKNLLRKHYTQNVDNLERLSGLPENKFIEAHGTFNTGHCTVCGAEYDFTYMRNQIMDKRVPICSTSSCRGVVKPDVVLFGENMPRKFYANYSQDFSACDLLIIMGTSLQVLPFCGLIHRVGSTVPRLYMNREYSQDSSTGFFNFIMRFIVAGLRRRDLQWGKPGNTRDVFVKGDCDESVLHLAGLLGWKVSFFLHLFFPFIPSFPI
ncbi:NAD-dependent protein deacetylase sirtuin-2, partial [Fasciolopsis buskii]